MVAMALLSRVVGSSAFRSAGRLRPTPTPPPPSITKFNYAQLAFTSSYITRALTSHHSSTYYRQRCFHPSVVCYGTASSSGNYARAELEGMTVNELKAKLREEGLPTSGLKAELIDRLSANNSFSDISDPSPDKKKVKPKQPQSSKRKFQINPNWKTEFNAKALEEEFDNMARKEGFDEKLAYFANDDTFEDEFTDDDYDIDLDEDEDGDDDDVDNDIPDFGQSTSQSMD